MKKLWRAFCLAVGTFSILPVPQKKWDESARSRMLVFLPVIGALCGLCWYFLALLPEGFLPAALMALLPFVFSGFIHLDGFMDCCDAILSRRDLQTRQQILKDSHVGAFAVICVAALMLVQFAAFCDMSLLAARRTLLLLPVCSRCVCALAVSILPARKESQYAGDFSRENKRVQIAFLLAELIAALASGFVFGGLAALGVCVLAAALAIFFAVRQLGGMSGDISGFALTVAEVCGIVTLCIIF